MRRCSDSRCPCQPGDPTIGTPGYAQARRHVDAGDLDGLRWVIDRLERGVPFAHVRFADQEFRAMLGGDGTNCDGQPLRPGTLGRELRVTLRSIATRASNVLAGGDWKPDELEWLVRQNMHTLVRWCPSQVFVNGIASGLTMQFLKLVRAVAQRVPATLVSNLEVSKVAPALGAVPVVVASRDAYQDMPMVVRRIIDRPRGSVVLWAAGLGCKPYLWDCFITRPDMTHIDVGCLFDGAVGIYNRTWLSGVLDDRRRVYMIHYVPWLLSDGREGGRIAPTTK